MKYEVTLFYKLGNSHKPQNWAEYQPYFEWRFGPKTSPLEEVILPLHHILY
jgi:hypothetical protein